MCTESIDGGEHGTEVGVDAEGDGDIIVPNPPCNCVFEADLVRKEDCCGLPNFGCECDRWRVPDEK